MAHPDFKLHVEAFASLAFAHAAALALGHAFWAFLHAALAFAHAFLHAAFVHLQSFPHLQPFPHLHSFPQQVFAHAFLALAQAALALGHALAALAGHETAALAFGASAGLLSLKMLHPVNSTTARIAINAFLITFPFFCFYLYNLKGSKTYNFQIYP